MMPPWLQTQKAKIVAVSLVAAVGLGAGVLALAMNGSRAPMPPAQRSSTPAPTVHSPAATNRAGDHSPKGNLASLGAPSSTDTGTGAALAGQSSSPSPSAARTRLMGEVRP